MGESLYSMSIFLLQGSTRRVQTVKDCPSYYIRQFTESRQFAVSSQRLVTQSPSRLPPVLDSIQKKTAQIN